MGKYSAILDDEAARQHRAPAAGASPYASVLDEEAELQRTRTRTFIEQAVKVNPDLAAERQRLARTSGLPLRVIERNHEEIKAKEYAAAVDLARLADSSPVLARQLADPTFTSVAVDDVPRLSQFELAMRGALPYLMGNSPGGGRGIIDTAYGSLYSTAAAFAGAKRSVVDLVEPWARLLSGDDNWFKQMSTFYGQEAAKAQARANALRPKSQSTFGTMVEEGVQSAVQNAKYLPMALTGPGGGAAALGGMVGETFGGSYNKAADANLPLWQKLGYASADAMVEYWTEKIPMERLLGGLQQGLPFFRMLGQQLKHEIPGEQLATVLQDLNEWATLDASKGKSIKDYLAERPEAALRTLVATVVGVGGNVAVTSAAAQVADAIAGPAWRDQVSTNQQAQLMGMLKAAGSSALRERSPEQFRALAQQIADADGGGAREVYVDAEVLAQLPQDVLAQLPDSVTGRIAEAAASGDVVAIPLADVLTVAPGTPLEQTLAEHARMDPFSLSPAEQAAAGNEAGQKLMAQAERVIRQASDQEALRQSQEVVRARLASEIAATGRFRPGVADSMASWAAAFYTAYGARLGMTPEAMHARYPLRITGEATPGGDVLNAPKAGQLDNLDAFHFSTAARPVISTGAFGTGLQGSAREEYLAATDTRRRKRSSFYVDKGTGINPEAGVGGIGHRVSLSNVYDANSDPLRLRKGDQAAFETAVLDAGFSGYLDRLGGTQSAQVVMLGDQTFTPEVLGPTARTTGRVVPAPSARESRGRDQVADRLRANKALPGGALEPARWGEVLKAAMPAEHAALEAAGAFKGDQPLYKSELVKLFESLTPAEQYAQRAVNTNSPHTARAKELLAGMKLPTRSAVGIMQGLVKTPVFDNIYGISKWFTQRNRRGMDNMYDSATQKRIVDSVYADLLFSLTDTGNAVGWYDAKVRAALDNLTQLHPELGIDEGAKFSFIVLLAITSNQTKVTENFALADALYNSWKKTGVFPTDVGAVMDTRAKTEMSKSLAKMRDMVAEHGAEKIREFMTTRRPVREIEAFTGYTLTGELKDAEVYGATFLGPKIGAFFNNLYGNFDTVTMDRWFMRTINRTRGSMLELPGSFGDMLTALEMQLQEQGDDGVADSETFGATKEALLEEIAAFRALPADQQRDIIEVAKVTNNIARYAKSRHSVYARGREVGGKVRSYVDRTPANLLSKNLDLALHGDAQTPRNGADRELLRGLVFKLQQKLKADGIDMVVADIQAALWYYEKDLFDRLRGKQADELFPTVQEAEDYETASRRLLAAAGIDTRGSAAGRAGPVRAAVGGATPAREQRVDNTGDLFAQSSNRATLDDFTPAGLPGLLSKTDWTILTAEDPGAQKATPEANAAAMAQLKADLDAMGAQYTEVVGKYGDLQGSLIVTGVAEQQAFDLGKKYGQESVLTRRGLVYMRDGSVTPATGMEVFDKPPEDFYTEVPSTGAFFSVSLDWDAPRVPDGAYAQAAYHGSPHTFNEFNLDAIGTGEGAQAYGWGLYFAESRDVARGYFERLAGRPEILDLKIGSMRVGPYNGFDYSRRASSSTLENIRAGFTEALLVKEADMVLAQEQGRFQEWALEQFDEYARGIDAETDPDRVRAAADLRRMLAAPGAVQLKLGPRTGGLYTVQVPDEAVGRMLLWDAPYEDQPAAVKKALRAFAAKKMATWSSLDKNGYAEFMHGDIRQGYVLMQEDGTFEANVDGPGRVGVFPNIKQAREAVEKQTFSAEANIFSPVQYFVYGPNDGPTDIARKFNTREEAQQYVKTKNKPMSIKASTSTATGAEIYQALEAALGSDKAASEALDAAGIPGSLHFDGFSRNAQQGTRNIVVWNRQVLAKMNEDVKRTLAQGNRGTFNPKSLELVMGPDADLSTFFHETGHFFLEVLADLGNRPDAPIGVRTDWETTLRWFGVNATQWAQMTLDQKRQYHERWAESIEQYVMEGKVPNQDLQPLMRRFSVWLKSVYRSVQAFLAGKPDAERMPLNEDIKRVMDRMVATDDQITQAEEVAGLEPVFEATQEAIERLQKRSMRDLKWAVNARDKVIASLRKKATEIERATRAAVAAEVELMPEVQAQAAMKHGDVLPEVAADAFGYPTVEAMNKAIELFGNKADVIDGLTERRMLEEHGDLVDDRAIQEAANDAVHNQARARSLASELKAQQDALGARADTGRANAAGVRITTNVLMDAAKQFGANVIGRTPLKDLKARAWQHTAAERRASTKWRLATEKGLTAEAVKAKQDQVLNHAAARAAQDAQREARKILEFFKKVAKGSEEDVVEKGRDPDYVNAARVILAAYGAARVSPEKANAYMETLKALDPDTHADLQPRVMAGLFGAQPLEALTFEELQVLHEQVESLWFLAKESRTLEVAGDRMDLDDAAELLRARMDAIGVPLETPGSTRALTDADVRKYTWLQAAPALLRRVEQWAQAKDGKYGGPFQRLIFQPVKDAADAYRAERTAYRKKFAELVKAVAPSIKGEPIAAPEIGYTFGEGNGGVGHAELLHALLHTGNESNKRKLLLGRGWATKNADDTLDTSRWDAFIKRATDTGVITKAHYDFAQGVWDLLERTKPGAQKTHRRVFGRYFAEVTADAFDTPFGQYRGGYVPAMADPMLTADAKTRALAERENENMAHVFPATAKGFTKSRVEYNRPLKLDLHTLPQHIDKVLLFTHLEPAVRGATRLLRTNTVSQPLNKLDPAAYDSMLVPWLNRAARQTVETPVAGDGRLNRYASLIRARVGMSLMFANISNTVQQLTGFSSAAVLVKPSHMLRAAAQFIAHPNQFREGVWAASTAMRDRAQNEVGVLNDTMDRILINPGVFESAESWFKHHAYFMQSAVDNVMSPIVWTGAYNQALQQGLSHEDAVRFSDGVVRQTQGSTLPEDISRFETGPAYARLFTQFFSYFNMVANTNATALQQIASEMGLRKGAGKALGVLFFGVLVPIWVAEAIALAFKGGPEDKEHDGYLDDWLASVFGLGTLKGLLAQVPILGMIGQSMVNRFNTNPADDKFSLSPAISVLESAASSPFSVYKAVVDDGNKQKAVRDVAALVTVLTGLPAAAAARPLGYAAELGERIRPTSAADAARGLVTGVASPESKVK